MNLDSNLALLVEQLRAELEGYGTLFRLLEEQRNALLRQNAEEILAISADIQDHITTLTQLRHEREGHLCEMGGTAPGQAIPSLSLLIHNLEHSTRPLLEELFREVNRLIAKSKNQLQRNQMLFRRAWDLGQQLIRNINPQQDFTPTYKRDGYSRKQPLPQRATYSKLA